MFGMGTDKDEKLAIKYYKQAANQGNIYANDRLSDIYKDGISVGQDIEKALLYNSKTRGNGNQNAEIKYLALLQLKSRIVTKNS